MSTGLPSQRPNAPAVRLSDSPRRRPLVGATGSARAPAFSRKPGASAGDVTVVGRSARMLTFAQIGGDRPGRTELADAPYSDANKSFGPLTGRCCSAVRCESPAWAWHQCSLGTHAGVSAVAGAAHAFAIKRNCAAPGRPDSLQTNRETAERVDPWTRLVSDAGVLPGPDQPDRSGRDPSAHKAWGTRSLARGSSRDQRELLGIKERKAAKPRRVGPRRSPRRPRSERRARIWAIGSQACACRPPSDALAFTRERS
jgi:hypothetical protein